MFERKLPPPSVQLHDGRGRGQFQRTRIGLVGKKRSMHACTEGLHFSAFHWVRVSVCVCLLSHILPTERLFVLKMLSRTQRATKVKIFVAKCLKQLRSRVMPRNMNEKANVLIRLTRGQLSPLDTQRSARGYQTIVNNIQPYPK